MSDNSSVIPFCFDSQSVRVIEKDGEPWFVAKDICDILDLNNVGEALRPLDEDELTSEFLMSGGQRREMKLISESGLYTLIIRSNKPQAKPFRRWVTKEVLPAIRKTGGYNLRDSKTVKVSHTHLRGSMAPGGLDIRYTMDLTKMVMKPSRTGIELLERLTGIPLVDVLPESGDEGDDVARFADECLVMIPDTGTSSRVLLADVYQRFLLWHRESFGRASLHSLKWLASRLRDMGLTVQASGGRTWIFGLRLVGEVRS